MACSMQIEGAHGLGPYASDGRPSKINVVGRVTGDCDLVMVTVHIPGGGLLYTGTISPVHGAVNAPRTFHAIFDLDWSAYAQRALKCGANLNINVQCVTNPACQHGNTFAIQCKEPPELGSDPTDDWDWWPFPWPPAIHCFASHQVFLAAFVAGLLGLVMWGSTPLPNSWDTFVISAFVTATIAWYAWTGFAPFGLVLCSPNYCKKLAALIWCYKWGVIGGAIIVVLNMLTNVLAVAAPGIVIPVLFGIITGLLANEANRLHCPVPSALTPPQNLPH